MVISDALFRATQRAKRRLRDSGAIRRVPLVKYTYALDPSPAIDVRELGFAFVPTAKVANRSIKAAVMASAFPGYQGDPHAAPWKLRTARSLSDHPGFRFGFVRNPLDRLYSLYSQKIVRYQRQMGYGSIFWRYGEAFWTDMTFGEFVEAVCAIPDWYADQHFRSQHTWFLHRGTRLVDFVGRFENLQADWEHVRQRVAAPLPELPHHNKSFHGPFEQAYSPRLLELASKRYAEDISLFGYSGDVEVLKAKVERQVAGLSAKADGEPRPARSGVPYIRTDDPGP